VTEWRTTVAVCRAGKGRPGGAKGAKRGLLAEESARLTSGLAVAWGSGPRRMPSPLRPSPAPRTRTVLVVEDAEDTRELFAVTLEDAGYRVLCAESVREALALLRACGAIDAVIADYSLTDGTGAELLHQAANEGYLDLSSTPAVICTAYRYVELPPHVAIVHKPIGPAELVREIDGRVRR